MTDSIDSHIDSKMIESDRSEIAILENIGEQGSVETEVVSNGKGSDDGNEVSAKVTENETREDHSENISKFNLSLDFPRSSTNHSFANYVSYKNQSRQFKSLYQRMVAFECPKWKTVIM